MTRPSKVEHLTPVTATPVIDDDGPHLIHVTVNPRAVIIDLAHALMCHAEDLRLIRRLGPADMRRVDAIARVTSDPRVTEALTLHLGPDQAELLAEDLDASVTALTTDDPDMAWDETAWVVPV